MNRLEEIVIEYLKQFSVIAEKIDESSEKTPDFIVNQEERVLIELKEKIDQKEIQNRKEEKLERGEIFEYSNTMGYKNRLAGVISCGIEQLKYQKLKTDSQYCLLFIVANGVAPTNQLEQISSTLYGKKSVIDFDSKSSHAKTCYYAYHSEFYKQKETINGAFIAVRNKVFLLINDQSPSYSQFKNSKFLSKFINQVHITDPIEEEKLGHAFIADCSIGRSNQDEVKNYVFEKYRINRGLLIDFPQIIVQSRINL
jgi:hypothetical protein